MRARFASLDELYTPCETWKVKISSQTGQNPTVSARFINYNGVYDIWQLNYIKLHPASPPAPPWAYSPSCPSDDWCFHWGMNFRLFDLCIVFLISNCLSRLIRLGFGFGAPRCWRHKNIQVGVVCATRIFQQLGWSCVRHKNIPTIGVWIVELYLWLRLHSKGGMWVLNI